MSIERVEALWGKVIALGQERGYVISQNSLKPKLPVSGVIQPNSAFPIMFRMPDDGPEVISVVWYYDDMDIDAMAEKSVDWWGYEYDSAGCRRQNSGEWAEEAMRRKAKA